MRYKKLVLRIALFVLPAVGIYSVGYAQPVQVFFKVTTLPPYSAYLSDYSNAYLVTLINQGATPVDVFLTGKLSNDQGQFAQTRANIYSLPIHLQVRQTLTLTGNQVDPYLFSPSKIDNHFPVQTFGNLPRDGQLPEGVYSFCITPYYYEAGRQSYIPLPGNTPATGCNNFVISTAKPPIITSPVDQQTLTPNAANALNFSWIRPSGVTGRANISYTLYLAKVNPGEDPNQTMTNVSEYGAGYFYKVAGLVQPIFQLNNEQSFTLEKGNRYVVMVQAVDNTHTLAIENNGRSVVHTFIYGASGDKAAAGMPQVESAVVVTAPKVKNTIPIPPVSEGPAAGSSFLSGNIRFAFDPDNFAPGQNYPLANIPVKLVKEYFVSIPQKGGAISMSLTSNSLSVSGVDGYDTSFAFFNFLNSHQVEELGYTTTDAQGNFQFAFPASKENSKDYWAVTVSGLPDFTYDKGLGKYIPKFANNVNVYVPGDAGSAGTVVGVNKTASNTNVCGLFSMMTLQVLNNYYYGPLVQVPAPGYNPKDSNFSIYFTDTLSNMNLGALNAYVADFNFHTHIKLDTGQDGFDHPSDHTKFNIYVLRKKTSNSSMVVSPTLIEGGDVNTPSQYSSALPPGETQFRYDKINNPVDLPDIIKKSPYEVVALANTNGNGDTVFTRLRCFSGDPSYYFYAEADAENDLNYAMPGILSLQDLINMNAINFSSNDPDRNLTLTLEPNPGRLWGYVRRNDSKYSVQNAQVRLSVNPNTSNQVNTDALGYYQFEPGVENTHTFTLDASKAGFLDDAVSFTGTLKSGQKIHTDLFIDTSATISGKIVDENGDGVDAFVSIQNGASVQVHAGAHYTDAQGYDHYYPATFSIGCPKASQTLVIDPVDNHYEARNLGLNVTKSIIDEATIVLKAKKRSIKFVVMPYQGLFNSVAHQGGGDGGSVTPAAKPIPDATITISVNGYKGKTDQNGQALFDLENTNALALSVKVEGPSALNYISSTTTVSIQAGSEGQTVYLYMKPGCQVQGFVNANGKEMPGATVIFKNGAPSNWLVATTDVNGYYELHGVPAGNGLIFDAGKQGYVGDEEKGNPNAQKHFTIDFALTKNGNIDYTRMLGFNMIVTKYDTAKKLLSGYFHQLPDNTDFKVLQDTLIPFSNIKVKTLYAPKGDYDYFYPEQMPLRTDLNKMELSAKGYGMRIQLNDPQNGILVTSKNNTGPTGSISSMARIDLSALQDATDLVFADDLYLRSSASVKTPDIIQTITADGQAPYNKDLPLSNALGAAIHFTYQGFSMEASPLTSVINSQQICKLAGSLTAHVVTDANVQQQVNIPVTNFSFSDHNGVSNSPQTDQIDSFSFQIQKWRLYGDRYTFGPDGFHIDKGHVQTTQVNVPFTDMVLKHNFTTGRDELKYGNYQLQNLDLAGVATLVVDPSAKAQFFFDPNQQRWQLIVAGQANTKVGTIQGLTPLNKDLGISEFALNSLNTNGHLQLTDESRTVSIYNGLANFSIGYIDVSPDLGVLNLSDGILDPGIPQLVSYGPGNSPSANNTLSFHRVNNQVVVDVLPFTLSGKASGVDLSFQLPKNALQPGGIKVSGVLSESGSNPYQLNVLLNHIPNSSIISIDPAGNRTLFIDATKQRSIAQLLGSMQTIANNMAWSKFKFEGDLTGCAHVASHLHFTINGEISVDPDQKIAVASIDNGGNGVNQMSFDFTKGELRGKISIPNENLGGGIGFGGSATIVVNQGGWFFVGNGNASFPDPIISSAGVVILLGKYANAGADPDIASAFAQSYFYQKNHGLPPNYQQLDGFLIDGQLSKSLIPTTSVSWDVGEMDVTCDVYGDLYLGAKLSDPKTLDIGGLVGAVASITASQSMGVVCVNGSATANIDGYFTGSVDASGHYCLSVGADVGLSGSMEIKGIVCGPGCTDVTVLGKTVTPCVDLVPKLDGGVKLSLSYGVGNQPNCSTGIKASLK